eukprot:TRINITY_DN20721_c0_g1_i2.p1 TRINITY_DN20721_c0_g1~~TRINITY_DN20721_c0_g1_i2.p1  ORF type:complete len:122 (+),score=16.89 TRINITY_DN20721_c0_g1_i2:121-486(+)
MPTAQLLSAKTMDVHPSVLESSEFIERLATESLHKDAMLSFSLCAASILKVRVRCFHFSVGAFSRFFSTPFFCPSWPTLFFEGNLFLAEPQNRNANKQDDSSVFGTLFVSWLNGLQDSLFL